MSLGHDVKSRRARNAAVFVAVVLLWLAFDQLTKAIFAGYEVGVVVPGIDLGIIDFLLVHNTGGAWGLFGDATPFLAIFSIAMCVLAVVYLFLIAPNSGMLTTVSLGLIVAGGIGNAIDRFFNGYVIDFIHTTFIDFPVFNVADIGVTCGVVLFVISLFVDAPTVNTAKDAGNADSEELDG